MSDAPAERAWAIAARAGSAQAFAQLVRAHQQALRAFLRRLSGNHADADDLAQETFVEAWKLIACFDTARSFRPWLFGIGWRKYRERRRRWLRLLRRESAVAQTDEAPLPASDQRLDLSAALAGLPLDQRAAVLLCLAAEFTHAEAAEALGLPLGTVKSHVARGRDKLATVLGDDHGA
jgi:RNA polymerase sigma-70 factor (ECF subfamily)